MKKEVIICQAKDTDLSTKFELKRRVRAKSFEGLNNLSHAVLETILDQIEAGLRIICVDKDGDHVREIKIEGFGDLAQPQS